MQTNLGGFRVLPNTGGDHAMVQITGHTSTNGPTRMGSFQIDAKQVRALAERLIEFSDELQG